MPDCRTTVAGLEPALAGQGQAGGRGDRPVAPTQGVRQVGFTLLEVMVAMAILALCVVPLLGAITQALRAATRIEQITTASELARNKLVQIELEAMPEDEESREGLFSAPHQDYSWRVVFSKRPELELLEEYLLGLKTMEVRLWVIWLEGGVPQSVEFSTLLVQ